MLNTDRRRLSYKLVIIVIITRFVPDICGENQSEMKLISRLNVVFNFDHHIFLLDPSVDAARFVNKTDFTPQTLLTLESFDDRDNNFTGLTTGIGSKNTFLIVVPSSESTTDFDSNFTQLHQMRNIQRLQVNMKIGIFFQKSTPIDNIRKLFEWCRQELIVNIFAAIYTDEPINGRSLNIYAFHPFKALGVINVTEYTNTTSFFPSLDFNFHRHRLRLSNENGYYFRKPVVMNFWDIVLRHMNASSFQVFNFTFSHQLGIDFDVATGSYRQDSLSHLNIDTLYKTSEVLIVPEATSYSDFSTYVLAITSDAFFGCFLVLLVGMILLLVIIRYINQQKFIIFESVADVVNLLMNDNGAIKYPQLARSEIYLVVPLTFAGLVAVNGILSALQSHVTRPINQPQIKTLEEIYESKFPILVWNDDWQEKVVSVLNEQMKFKNWHDKVMVMDAQTFGKHRLKYNMSMAYLSDIILANTLIRVQRQLKIKGFYNTGIVITSSIYSYRVGNSFIFLDRLNEIIQRIQSSGLYELWLRQTAAIDEKFIFDKNSKVDVRESKEDEALDFPVFIVYGWICATIVLVLEIIWKKLQLRWMKKKMLKHGSIH